MAGRETICLHSWHSGMIIHFNDKTWDKGFVRPRTHSRTHTKAWEPSVVADTPVALLAHSLSQNPWKPVTKQEFGAIWGGMGPVVEGSLGGIGRKLCEEAIWRQSEGNLRRIRGQGLIVGGTDAVSIWLWEAFINKSSPGWPNQSLSALPAPLYFHPLRCPSLLRCSPVFRLVPCPQWFT